MKKNSVFVLSQRMMSKIALEQGRKFAVIPDTYGAGFFMTFVLLIFYSKSGGRLALFFLMTWWRLNFH